MRIQNHAMCFSNFLFLLSNILIGISLTTAQRCYNTGNFTTDSVYGKNRNLILSTLASNVSRNGGFYTATIGQDPNEVYALALCRGDSSSETCFSCVNSTTQDLIAKCPNQNEALSWGKDSPCIVRYANRSFFGQLEQDPREAGYNVNDIIMFLVQYDQTWESLMDRVVTKASLGSSKLKFAAEEANLTYFQRIYALAQCTPDLSQANCDYCLRQSVGYFQICCPGKRGGYVQTPNCIFRWDLYPFYEAAAPAPSASPPAAPTIPPAQTTNKTPDKGGIASVTVAIIVIFIIIFIALVALTSVFFWRKTKKVSRSKQETKEKPFSVPCPLRHVEDEIETVESLQFGFSTIKAATNDFAIDNKLGQGGFGAVYKGRLLDGQDVAVKRLSRDSGQGEVEFKNEVLLVAKLQHRNLVRLRGFCCEERERLLVYEFVPNSSLDNFIFDPIKRLLLDWEKRYKIIRGIARGILYLHEDSRLRIVHRDLKANNILLDTDMIPKISDFGMARLFEMDQTRGDTSRIVGTFGYMAPEYVKHGHFSVKSDVFSFGVLVLEIISGQKNSCFRNGEEGEDLLTYGWRNWKEGKALTLMDPSLGVGSGSEIMRCIHIGLLCVQENEASRPTMTSVVLMLTSSSIPLSVPSEPAFFMHTTMEQGDFEVTVSGQSESNSDQVTVNEASITELAPR